MGRLASGLGLLRLPRMPDLRKPLGAEDFVPSPVDPATVPYKDKAREKQRQKVREADGVVWAWVGQGLGCEGRTKTEQSEAAA